MDEINTDQQKKSQCTKVQHFSRHFRGKFFQSRLQKIERYHTAEAKENGGRKRDSTFKIKSETRVGLPWPAAGQILQNIAGNELHHGCNRHTAKKNQEWTEHTKPRRRGPFHQPAKTKNKNDGTKTVNGTIGTEQNAPINKAFLIDKKQQQDLGKPPDHGINHKTDEKLFDFFQHRRNPLSSYRKYTIIRLNSTRRKKTLFDMDKKTSA